MALTSRQADQASMPSPRPPHRSVLVEDTMTDGHLLLVVVGEADLHSAPTLRADLLIALDRRPGSVVVDVSRLAYCDLAGLDALNDFCAAATAAGVPTVIDGMSPLLAWLRARFPAAHSTPSEVDRSRPEFGSVGDARPGQVAAARPPRPWPVR